MKAQGREVPNSGCGNLKAQALEEDFNVESARYVDQSKNATMGTVFLPQSMRESSI